MLHMKKPKAQIHANNLFFLCSVTLKWQTYVEIWWKYDVCHWSLLRWNEKKHVWKFIKAQTRIQNDLEQPNPNFPFSGLRLLEAVHVGWLELPSCQFYQLMKRISRFSDVSFMYLFRFRFWRCWMYFNVSECHHFFCGLLRPFFGATQANSLRLCQGFQKRMLNKQNE